MTCYVALLRAVNVSGTGMLPMAELRAMGAACGFTNVRTHIASGNLLFESDFEESAIKTVLETKLAAYAGKPIEVFVRTGPELAAIVATNPFSDAHGSRHLVYFFEAPPAADLISQCRDVNGERLSLNGRELHVDYGDGIRYTKLKIPGKTDRTGRNMNTVQKLAQMLGS